MRWRRIPTAGDDRAVERASDPYGPLGVACTILFWLYVVSRVIRTRKGWIRRRSSRELTRAGSSPKAGVDPDERKQDDDADDGADDSSEIEDVGVADAKAHGKDEIAQQGAGETEQE